MPDPPTNSESMNPEISQILEPIRLIPTKNNTKTNSPTFGSLVLELVGCQTRMDILPVQNSNQLMQTTSLWI